MAIDLNGGGILPTITIEDADRATKEEQEKANNASETPSAPTVPGQYPSGVATMIPDWYKVGWRAVANIDASALEEGEEKDKYVLQLFLSEQYYGQWYHNAAIMFFVSLCYKLLPFTACSPACRCIGCICFPFPDAIQFRLGMVNHLDGYLQHLLYDFNGPCPPLRS